MEELDFEIQTNTSIIRAPQKPKVRSLLISDPRSIDMEITLGLVVIQRGGSFIRDEGSYVGPIKEAIRKCPSADRIVIELQQWCHSIVSHGTA